MIAEQQGSENDTLMDASSGADTTDAARVHNPEQQGSDESGEGLRAAERRAVDLASTVFGWQHLARYSGQTQEWLNKTLGAIVRSARHDAESAEAALATARRDADEMRDRLAAVEVYATGMLHEADHLDQLGDHDEAGSIRHYGYRIRAALANPSAAQGEQS